MKLIYTLFILLFLCQINFAQNITTEQQNHKGEFYFYWGWNRGTFSNSDIHFKGDDYDFTLKNVVATDRQSPLALKTYFHPTYLTIPQYNFRIGYFFHKKYNISIGSDHMKYIVKNDQTVKISGHIKKSGTPYDANYDNSNIALTEDFLRFEHTDGLNYINMEIRRLDEIFDWSPVKINLTEGVGTGILFPRTNSTLLNQERNDEFHLSGFGVSALLGIQARIYKHFFIQTEMKGGWVNMPNIRTTNSTSDKASQRFFFGQWNVVFGASFNLRKNSK